MRGFRLLFEENFGFFGVFWGVLLLSWENVKEVLLGTLLAKVVCCLRLLLLPAAERER